jgi:hypothetical protein
MEPSAESTRNTGRTGEAWAAIGAVGAAVITGVVALLVHLTPAADREQPETRAAQSRPATTASTSRPASAKASPAEPMIGSWKGTATDTDNTVFRIAASFTQYCHLKEYCGSIAVPDVPCYGDLYLEKVTADDIEFKVQNFKAGSDPKCTPGGGEHFQLRSDGTLSYYASYGGAHGTLNRT